MVWIGCRRRCGRRRDFFHLAVISKELLWNRFEAGEVLVKRLCLGVVPDRVHLVLIGDDAAVHNADRVGDPRHVLCLAELGDVVPKQLGQRRCVAEELVVRSLYGLVRLGELAADGPRVHVRLVVPRLPRQQFLVDVQQRALHRVVVLAGNACDCFPHVGLHAAGPQHLPLDDPRGNPLGVLVALVRLFSTGRNYPKHLLCRPRGHGYDDRCQRKTLFPRRHI